MVTALKACPFSGRLCRECPIYLGRHAEICAAARYRDGRRPKLTYGCTHLKFEFPEDVSCSAVRLKDLEDLEENIKEAKIVWTG